MMTYKGGAPVKALAIFLLEELIWLIWENDELSHTEGEKAWLGMRYFFSSLSDKTEIWFALVNQKEHIHFLH